MNFLRRAENLSSAENRRTVGETDRAECAEHSHISSRKCAEHHIPGMEGVIVTVSGYDPAIRSKLVKLIVHLGASNTGSLSRGNTHVVCWKFAGRKYELAKKLKKKIISHRWFEECLKAGAPVPEEPYINKSGLEEAPFSWDDSGIDSPLRKADKPRKVDSTIDLTSSTSHPENRAGWDGGSLRHDGLSARKAGRSDVEQSDKSWRTPTCPKGPVASTPGYRNIVSDKALSDAAPSQAGKSLRSVKSSEELVVDGSRKTAESSLSRAKLELRREKDVGASPLLRSPLTDQSNGVRHQNGNVYASRACSTETGQPTRQTYFPSVWEQYSSGRYPDANADYSQMRMRRRKEVDGASGSLSEKYRRIMIGSAVPSWDGVTYAEKEARSEGRPSAAGHVGSPSSKFPWRRPFVEDTESDNQRFSNPQAQRDEVAAAVSSSPPSNGIACVICHTETKPTTEGLLGCGHRYCYPCIQQWADEATSRQATCPLCKASFEFITIRELQRSADEATCTQVLDERVVSVGRQIRQGQKVQLSSPGTEDVCITCESRDSPGHLMTCNTCRQRSCHTFCLDPPAPLGSSWTCSRCSHMRSRGLLREAVLSRFGS
ncbi:hypothetical protein R1sor_009491 [Riccia sorocarpa]|uniref:RING-type E3 ubiquitin transferase BRCA1 n=1 Tax=Riccia sorocarpa TaxID=122646 RepID=A0ABD3HV81_9MARC